MGNRSVRSKDSPANEVAGLVLFALAALLMPLLGAVTARQVRAS